jgi:universal stress protein A
VVDPKRAGDPESGLLAAEILEDRRRESAELLSRVVREITAPSPLENFLREGNPATEILEAAREWKADLVVIGSHGRRGLARLVMGSVAEGVTRHAPVPVLVVR